MEEETLKNKIDANNRRTIVFLVLVGLALFTIIWVGREIRLMTQVRDVCTMLNQSFLEQCNACEQLRDIGYIVQR